MVAIESREALINYLCVLYGMLQEYPDAMTVEQLMSALNIKEKQAYKKIHSGEIPALWIGNSYRILKAEVVLYLAMQSLELVYLSEEKDHDG